MDTTRTYPRTLVDAFPRTTEYACAIEGPSKGVMVSPWFWAGGVASIVVWTLFVLAVV